MQGSAVYLDENGEQIVAVPPKTERGNSFPLENWTTQLRKGVLELCILSLLSNGRLYGYDIVKQLSAIPGLVLAEGTLYPLLSRLRKSGLLTSELEESAQGPARKYYVLTEEGERVLRMMDGEWQRLSQGIEAILRVDE